jgi:anti-sigma factor RsiW
MNCTDFEKLIALHVESDLPERKGAAVAEHLNACRNCQEFAERLKASQAMLKSLAQESVDEAALQQLHRRVLNGLEAEVQSPPPSLWRYALGAGLVAAMVFTAIMLWHPIHPSVRKGSTQAPAASPLLPKESATKDTIQASNPVHRDLVRTAKVKRALPRRAHSQNSLTASVKSQQPAPLMVKLVTDDPNVVIYWLVD